MLNALWIDASEHVTSGPDQFWIGGADLLKLVDHAIGYINTGSNVAKGTGTLEDPWVMNGECLTWLNMARHLHKFTGPARYFWICGRHVKKVEQGYYMVDAGGDNDSTTWNQMPSWNRDRRQYDWFNFERGGPSYRNFANYMDGIRNGKQNQETWSKDKAKELMSVLKSDNALVERYSKAGDWTTGQVLPALAATMFLAEPGRNIRAFLANRALMDMMAWGWTYGGRKQGSRPKAYTWSKTLLGNPNDQLKGGKSSAANAGSGQAAGRGNIGISPTNDPHEYDDGSPYYSQAKEVTLLCRYLDFEGTGLNASDESLIDKRNTQQLIFRGNAPINDHDFSTPENIMGHISNIIQTRLASWG